MMLSKTYDLFNHQAKYHFNEKAIVCRSSRKWITYSTADCISEIKKYQQKLLSFELKKESHIVLVPGSATAAFLFLDLAIQSLGLSTVMVHNTMNPDQFDHIYNEISLSLIIFDNQNSKDKFGEIFDHRSKQFLIDEFEELEGSSHILPEEGMLDNVLSTIIYTSGTTGQPKGVMLSHQNIMSNVAALAPLLPLTKNSRVLSYLPYSHVLERTAIFSYIVSGCSIYLLSSPNYLPKALLEIRPDLFTAVPRIIERMYNEVFLYKSKKSKFINLILDWSLREGVKYSDQGGFRPLSWFKLLILRNTVFRKFRNRLGGNLKAIVVGAAHLNENIARIFAAAKIPLREGYGLTEASPVITVNRMQKGLHKISTVGLPLPGVEIKILNTNENDEGEIFVKGNNVMLGYFNKPEETKKVLDEDRWLNTGDIGKIVDKRFLKITDRKKDIFKTSVGKYIAPQKLESHFKKSKFIEQLLIIGFQQPFVSSLIYPNYQVLEEWAIKNKIHWTSPKYMAINRKIIQKIEEEIEILNRSLPNYERIIKFTLLDEDWSVEKGQLSNTLKPIRKKIVDDYKKEIQKMYSK